ncbi:MAG TPA: OmpH family outer membrane protein [Terriglobales bacterium]|nr:OmpH family outer membrane protein [Terriglobales bacterium]
MKPKFLCSLTAAFVVVSAMAFAQAGGSSSTALPSAPGTAGDPPAAVATGGGSQLAAINIEGAIFASNEGQRDMDALQKKFQPKSDDLKGKNDEIEALKKKLNTQGASLNDDAKADLQRQIETKQKSLDREAQDAREDFQTQQNEIGQRILQKMAPIILKYANEHSLGVIIDTSNPWPQGQVVWASPSVDITKPVVEAYNVQSGVAPPPKPASTSGSARPAGTGLGAPRATSPVGSKPATSTTPPK